jgi:YD repeat-containing protein
VRTFVKAVGSSVWSATNGADVLTQAGGTWLYRRADDDAVLAFTADGKLQTRTERGGFTYTYAYDGSGRLASVSNGFGRSLVFAYAGGKLATVTLPNARVIGYTYDASGRLATVLYPDGKSRGFLYENASFPQALTGILDESGVRWGTFAYDSSGRAISTELAGGVDRYQVRYPYTGAAIVTDPLNTNRSYVYATAAGKLAVTSGSLPSGKGEADASGREQDANGLITSETDFKGVRTDYVWDVSRRLRTSVTEASGTPDARTTTYQWHASMALPTLVTEAGRSTAYTYDAQGRALTKSITDTLVTPNTTKTWTWTYNAQGLVGTEQAPSHHRCREAWLRLRVRRSRHAAGRGGHGRGHERGHDAACVPAYGSWADTRCGRHQRHALRGAQRSPEHAEEDHRGQRHGTVAVELLGVRGGRADHGSQAVCQRNDQPEHGHDKLNGHYLQPTIPGASRGQGGRLVLQLFPNL